MSSYYVNELEIIEVGHDFFATDPRNNDEFSTFITTFGNFDSPDETEFNNFNEIERYFGMQFTGTTENYLEKLRKNADKKGYFLMPVYCINNDDLNYTTKKTPDGSLAGVIYTTKKKIYEEYNVTRLTPKIKSEVRIRLENECKNYSLYINGYCYCVSVYDRDTFEQVDYCGDLLGKDIHEAGIYEMSNLIYAKYFGDFYSFDEFKAELEKKDIKDKFEKIRKNEYWTTSYKQETEGYCDSRFRKFETIPTIDQVVDRYNDFRHDVIDEIECNFDYFKSDQIDLLTFLETMKALCNEYQNTVCDVEFICNDFKYSERA